MKYRTGMKVRIVRELDPLDPFGTNDEMEELQGRIATITYAGRECLGVFYRIDLDGGLWSWSENMLETIAINKGK